MKKIAVLVIIILLSYIVSSCSRQEISPPAYSSTQPSAVTSTSITVPTSKEGFDDIIYIDGVMNDWPPTAVMITDPPGDFSSDVKINEGVDLKAVYALIDKDYLYVAIQIYGAFAPSLLRNYFILLDLNNDQQAEFQFGFRPNGETWVFNYAKDRDNPSVETTSSVAAGINNDVIEAKISREEYAIPQSIFIGCIVTEGYAAVDSIYWFPCLADK